MVAFVSPVVSLAGGLLRFVYGIYATIAFLALSLLCLAVILLPLSVEARRAVTHWFARVLFMALGVRVTLHNAERLPAGACVVVANHASYLDGVVMKAMLPARFSFVIKKEMSTVPLGGLLLRRIGSQFVERGNRQGAAADARRMMKLADSGQALVFFPEGTFIEQPGIMKFHSGAFVIAARAGLPVVPVALKGTRDMLRNGQMLLRPGRIHVLVQPAIMPFADISASDSAAKTRDQARAVIAEVSGEPVLE
jgi:1-acyl-sn-glycerol-3-phosphate acyltransferase